MEPTIVSPRAAELEVVLGTVDPMMMLSTMGFLGIVIGTEEPVTVLWTFTVIP